MPRNQELRDCAAAIVSDHVNSEDRESVQKLDEHRDLRIRRYTLAIGDFCVSEREEIWSNTSPVR